jgi:hypothetical protein
MHGDFESALLAAAVLFHHSRQVFAEARGLVSRGERLAAMDAYDRAVGLQGEAIELLDPRRRSLERRAAD